MPGPAVRSYVFQEPRVGRLLQRRFALLFLVSCIMDEQGRTLFLSTPAEKLLERAGETSGVLETLFGGELMHSFVQPAKEGDWDAVMRVFGKTSLIRNGNAVTVLDLRSTDSRRVLLYGWEEDVVTGAVLSYAAWAFLDRYDFSVSPGIPFYPFLRALDRHPDAWLGIIDDRRYYHLSPGLVKSYFQNTVSPDRIVGSPMYQFMPPEEARRHAEILSHIEPDSENDITLRWRHIRLNNREAWIQTWPNVMTVNGEAVNFSMVQDITGAEGRPEHEAVLDIPDAAREKLADFQGVSSIMRYTAAQMVKAASSNAAVTISGETGTGKSVAARLIHEMSTFGTGPFVSINCGAVPEGLFESAFFGHVRGAFTGAVQNHRGVMAQAAGGTLFLDEVGDLPLRCQVKLLQALSERRFRPVGADSVQMCQFRLITATNRDLAELVREGRFREDLFYRINVFELHLPPLRERKEDIPWLLTAVQKQHGLHIPFSEKELARLRQHRWPGNIREFENVVLRRAAETDLGFFHPSVNREEKTRRGLKERLLEEEKRLILEALEKHRWSRNAAAEELGISRVTLFRKMRELNI